MLKKLAMAMLCLQMTTGVMANDITPEQHFVQVKKKAEQGDAEAQLDLAFLYSFGRGVKKNDVEARKWLEKSVAQNEPYAVFSKGLMYRDGLLGVKQDYAQAKIWFEKAIQLNDTSAMIEMGNLYLNGHGVQQDFNQAEMWFNKAVALGTIEAEAALASVYIQRARQQGGNDKLYKQAKLLLEKALQANLDENMKVQIYHMLGLLYQNGWGVAQDYKIAYMYFSQASDGGNLYARMEVIRSLYHGTGVEKNQAFAIKIAENLCQTHQYQPACDALQGIK